MAWYDRFIGRTSPVEIDEEKVNPSQYLIGREEGLNITSRENVTNYRDAYEKLEVVNRAVNIVVDDVAEIPVDVGGKVAGMTPVYKNVRRATVNRLLNIEPNPFQDVNSFKRNLIIDLLIDGNIFVEGGKWTKAEFGFVLELSARSFLTGIVYLQYTYLQADGAL